MRLENVEFRNEFAPLFKRSCELDPCLLRRPETGRDVVHIALGISAERRLHGREIGLQRAALRPRFLQLRLGPLHILMTDHSPVAGRLGRLRVLGRTTHDAGLTSDQLGGHPRRLALQVAHHRLLDEAIRSPFGLVCISAVDKEAITTFDAQQSSLQLFAFGIKRCRVGRQAGARVDLLTDTVSVEFDLRHIPLDRLDRALPTGEIIRSARRCLDGAVTLRKRFSVNRQLGLGSFDRSCDVDRRRAREGEVDLFADPAEFEECGFCGSDRRSFDGFGRHSALGCIGDRPSAGRARRSLGRCVDGRRFVGEFLQTGAMLASSVVPVGSGSGLRCLGLGSICLLPQHSRLGLQLSRRRVERSPLLAERFTIGLLGFVERLAFELLLRLGDRLHGDAELHRDFLVNVSNLRCGCLAPRLEFLGDCGEDVTAEETAQELFAIFRVVEQKALHLTLREHHHALELFSVEPDQIVDVGRHVLHTRSQGRDDVAVDPAE